LEGDRCDEPGEKRTASIASTPGDFKRVTRQVAVRAEEVTGSLPEIGNDNNLRLIVSGPGFEPCLPLTHVVRRSQVCVSITAPDLESAELVNQKEIDHAGDRIGAIHRRGAILQDVDMIDHRKRNQINIRAGAEPDTVQRTKGHTLSINQHESFLGQKAAQVELNSTVASAAHT